MHAGAAKKVSPSLLSLRLDEQHAGGLGPRAACPPWSRAWRRRAPLPGAYAIAYLPTSRFRTSTQGEVVLQGSTGSLKTAEVIAAWKDGESQTSIARRAGVSR